VTTLGPQAARYAGVVDTGRYPLGDPASPAYLALVLHCRDQLREAGVAQLPGFLTPTVPAQEHSSCQARRSASPPP
jgi:hypothetical protein